MGRADRENPLALRPRPALTPDPHAIRDMDEDAVFAHVRAMKGHGEEPGDESGGKER